MEENKLINVNINENQLELTNEGIKFIKKLQKAKLELERMESELKAQFLDKMETNGIKNFISNDGTFKVTYVAETTSKKFDSKRFKEEQPDLYNEYLKESTTKSYVRFN